MAWLTPLGSAAALAQAIDEALSLPVAERELLAPAAIANVRVRFTKDAMCTRTLLVYRELVGS
jgi:glycosyltransferase involved in cell wall biosynthesis